MFTWFISPSKNLTSKVSIMIYNIVLIKCYFTCIPNRENKGKKVTSTLPERILKGLSRFFSDVPEWQYSSSLSCLTMNGDVQRYLSHLHVSVK